MSTLAIDRLAGILIVGWRLRMTRTGYQRHSNRYRCSERPRSALVIMNVYKSIMDAHIVVFVVTVWTRRRPKLRSVQGDGRARIDLGPLEIKTLTRV